MSALTPIVRALFMVALLCVTGQVSAHVRILLSHSTPPYRALADSISAYIDGQTFSIIDVGSPGPDSDTPGSDTGMLNIAVGSRAMDYALKTMPNIPLLATLVPSNAYEDLLKTHEDVLKPGKVSAVFPDQPLERQVAFVHLLMPDKKRMGVLVGQHSFQYVKPLTRLASARGLSVTIGDAREDRIPDAIKDMLAGSDFVLALHDSSLLTPNHAKWLLYMAYQRRIPVIGYSKTYVRAGALAALYSSNDQIGRQVSSMLGKAGLRPRYHTADIKLPKPEYPNEFSIELNNNVADSFALWGIDPDLIADRLRHLNGKGIEP
ncbi:MAG: hypothetical protein GC138_01830 [Gammaproteobacteria bacterium]|nr:hypothetical protein [Gammaproteobacteria bacterium]